MCRGIRSYIQFDYNRRRRSSSLTAGCNLLGQYNWNALRMGGLFFFFHTFRNGLTSTDARDSPKIGSPAKRPTCSHRIRWPTLAPFRIAQGRIVFVCFRVGLLFMHHVYKRCCLSTQESKHQFRALCLSGFLKRYRVLGPVLKLGTEIESGPGPYSAFLTLHL